MSEKRFEGSPQEDTNDTAAADAQQTPAPPAEDTENDSWEQQRDEAKAQGDQAFQKQDFAGAIQFYTQALSLDPDNAKILSNRSAAYLKASEKSKALHDAQKCVDIGTMGVKGISRLAAALQALGRYEKALEQYQSILDKQADHAVALQGVSTCQEILQKQKQEEETVLSDPRDSENGRDETEDGDDLDDFFNEMEEVAETVKKERFKEPEQVATNAIKNAKKDLGTAKQQIERLLQTNYHWKNLNPYYVLDISHTASKEEISKRYKAISLLLHPDKNPNEPRAQEAYDEVLKAKAALDNDMQAKYTRDLAEEGMKQGEIDWKRGGKKENLGEMQKKAVFKIFAQVEQSRKEVAEREKQFEERQKQMEREAEEEARKSYAFSNEFKKEEHVEKRIGNWRDFQQKKKAKKAE